MRVPDAPRVGSFFEQMMYWDLVSYLPDDILVKIDRSSMANSLEVRVPLLDHRVVELAWRISMDQKVRGGVGKHILREILHKHVPRELIERPKQGFSVPLANWLRGPLVDWVEDLLDERRLRLDGFLDATLVRGYWEEHRCGRRDWSSGLWALLMFQAWYREWHG